MSKYFFSLFVIVLSLLSGVCLAEDVALSDDFQDLGPIGVKVTTSHSEESFLAKQLTKEKVYLIVEDRLNLARIEILEGDSFHIKLGEPYLSVVVTTMPIESTRSVLHDPLNRLHMFCVKVSLFETATLIRNGKKTVVSAWGRNIMGWSKTPDGIEKVVKEMVERFIRQYISTNTK